jgi:4-amino-4-deoxy-L-arabinose transferase-like glycosyltransferase
MAAAAIGLAIVLLAAGAVRWTPPSVVADLQPWPDAREYEEAGRRLAAGEGYIISVEGDPYPPRYPPGLSLLLVPFLCADASSGAGIRGVFVAALVALVGVAVVGHLVGGGSGAVAATLVLAASPLHVRWSRAVMSDVPASAVVAVLGAAMLLALRRGAGARTWCMIGLGLGLGTAVRQSVAPLALPAIALLATDRGGARGRRLLALAVGCLVGVLPMLAFDAWLFGSPVRTGYGYWAPGVHFDPSYLWAPPPNGGSRPNVLFYGGMLGGDGGAYTRPIAVLLGVAVLVGLRRRDLARALTILAVGYTAALVGLYGTFYWQAERFLVPALPLLAGLAAIVVGREAPGVLRLGAAALLIAGVLSIGDWRRAFDPPTYNRGAVETLRLTNRLVEPNAAVLAATNSYFFERELRADGDRVWIPLGYDRHRLIIGLRGLTPLRGGTTNAPWVATPVGRSLRPIDARETIDRMLATGRPVYLLKRRAFRVANWSRLLRVLQRWYRLRPVAGASEALLVRIEKPEPRVR